MKRIREFAKLCDTTTKTLRFWDNAGVLKADYIDPVNGYRYYSEKQVEEYRKIMELKQVGFTLDEIRSHFGEIGDERRQLFIMLYHLREKKAALQEALENCEKLIQTYEEKTAPVGPQTICRIDDRQEILLTNGRRTLSVACRPEGMDICMEVLEALFGEKGYVNLDIEDILLPEDQKSPVLVQQIEGSAEELLSADVTALFTEADHLHDVRTVLYRLNLSNGTAFEEVNRLAGKLERCFSDQAVILWGTDLTAPSPDACKLQIVGIY